MPVRRRLRFCPALLGIAAALASGGCVDRRFETAEVTGTVTVDGEPAGGVRLEFIPARRRDERPPLAYGFTDASGAYVARSRAGRPGTVVGMNRVSITLVESGALPVSGRMLEESDFDREVRPGADTLDFDLRTRPVTP